jgi:hypothetical protein
MVNTSFMMGGALGLAVLASIAANRTQHAVAAGLAEGGALNAGYHLAFATGAGFALLAALIGVVRFAGARASAQAGAGGHAM